MTPSQGGKYCDFFAIYKEICGDMPMMKGCQDYKALCTPKGYYYYSLNFRIRSETFLSF